MNTKALKQKILDLAIHGKLLPLEKVEQIRKEEPASVLLEKIRAEKQEKIAKGEQKKDKNDSFIFVGDDKRHYEKFVDGSVKDIEDEIPFDVPEGWSWCRLGEICNFIGGGTPDKTNQNYWNGNIHWASVKDIKGDNLFSTEDKITELGLKESSANLAKIDDIILITRISPGKAIITKIETAINQDLKIVIPKIELEKYFLLYFFQTNESDFIENSSGTTVKGIKLEYLLSKFIPLPPLSEQKLIVEEIEKIFAQIDLLEQNKTDLQTAIKQAKSKILDLAIHGKLVPQDPSDEPASVLLEKIRAEKEEKIAKGDLKRDKNDSYIYKSSTDNCHYQKNADGSIINIEEEIPFDVPESWCWCRLGEICELKGGKRIPAGLSATKEKTHHIYIRVTDMKNNSISDDDLVYIDENIFEKIQRYTINKNDLYLTIAGTIGRVGIVPEKFDGMNLTENALKLTDIKINKNFLMNILNTSFVQDYFASTYHQVAMPKLSLINASKTLILLPPLSEQTRIVAKIEELFELFDKIQSNIL